MTRPLVLAALLLVACGPAPGYNANGEFVADPNAGLASPRRGYADPSAQAMAQPPPPPPESSGGAAQAQPMTQGGDPVFYDDLAAASGGRQPTPAPAPAQACDDSCRFAHNGECDDGRPGSDTDVCATGTDCGDCGG